MTNDLSLSNEMGLEVMERLHFLASLPLSGTWQGEGGRFSCINKRIISHHVRKALAHSTITHISAHSRTPKERGLSLVNTDGKQHKTARNN